MISATGKPGSINRHFSEMLLDIINNDSNFNESYTVKTHVQMHSENLYDSLDEALRGDEFEGYIILLDSLEANDVKHGLCNPNVMFEFGAIKHMGKPFAVIATGETEIEDFPFDVRNINIAIIPSAITEYAKKSYTNKRSTPVIRWLKDEVEAKEKSEIDNFLVEVYKNYQVSLGKSVRDSKYTDRLVNKIDELMCDNRKMLSEVGMLTKSFSDRADYIDGEGAAFAALSDAVAKAEHSLRTSRFANQSIVQDPTKEQTDFMNALYEKSKELKGNCVRIVCNNHPAKWNDIFNILFNGGSGTRVYVRKNDFSIYFELVVIDEQVAFIHFYQKVHSMDADGNVNGVGIEKINSTLKLQGRSICTKFADIFDRLHHRDFKHERPSDPSRTLIGIPLKEEIGESVLGRGYFEYTDEGTVMPAAKSLRIMNMLKNAFQTWDIQGKDKMNMVVGIALVENSPYFLDEMHRAGRLSDEEYDESKELYAKNLK